MNMNYDGFFLTDDLNQNHDPNTNHSQLVQG
jgi:hypothetical protein